MVTDMTFHCKNTLIADQLRNCQCDAFRYLSSFELCCYLQLPLGAVLSEILISMIEWVAASATHTPRNICIINMHAAVGQ